MKCQSLKRVLEEKNATRIYKLCLDSISKIENINKEFKAPTGFLRQDNIYFTNKFMQRGAVAKEFDKRKDSGFDGSIY